MAKRKSLAEIQAENTRLLREGNARLAELDREREEKCDLESMHLEASISTNYDDADAMFSDKYPNITDQYWCFDCGIAEMDRQEADWEHEQWVKEHPVEQAAYLEKVAREKAELDRMNAEWVAGQAERDKMDHPF